jgi:hypothetical protein
VAWRGRGKGAPCAGDGRAVGEGAHAGRSAAAGCGDALIAKCECEWERACL